MDRFNQCVGKLFHLLKYSILLFLTKAIPVKKNRWVFMSYEGHYTDSPKIISEMVHELNPHIEIIWLIDYRYKCALPSYVKPVDIKNNLSTYIYCGSAEILIDNIYAYKATVLNSSEFIDRLKYHIIKLCRKKKGQKAYTTWHGTPLKKMGRDLVNGTEIAFSCPQTTMILGNQYTLNIMQHLTYNKIKMKLLGTPRNDIFFDLSEEKIRNIKQQLGIPNLNKIILFAPTFRSDGYDGLSDKNVNRSGINQLHMIDFPKLFSYLEAKLNGNWVFICRFHNLVEKMVDWDALQKKYQGKVINGNQCDHMEKYLAITDVLLTDASSCMFDFSLTKRPCFLFFPDLKYYVAKERGLYVPIEQLPFPLAQTFEELLDNISNFDNEIYQLLLEKMKNEFGFVDHANSSKEIVNYILSENGCNETIDY